MALQQRLIKQTSALLTRGFSTKLPEELRSLQEMCRKFSEEELKPVAGQIDRECKYPRRQIEKLGELGLMGVCAAQRFGGSGMSTLALSLVVEELSRGCGSTGAIVSIHNCLYVNLLDRIGTDEQKERFLKPFVDGNKVGAFALSESGEFHFLCRFHKSFNFFIRPDAGSDVAAMSTTAHKDGNSYILSGTKAWVTSALEAEAGVVFATLNKEQKHKGIAAFIVDLKSSGVELGKNEKKLGLKGSSTCSIILNEVRIPSENLLGAPSDGFKIAMEQLDTARIGIASLALGIAQASLDTAIDYASQRIAFTKPILEMSSVQSRLAEMATKIESTRLLVRRAAEMKDDNLKSTKFTSMAKWQASETATFCAHNCIQILGGMGVVEDLPAERYYRDARITEIFGGITDVQKLIIAGQLRKDYGL